VVDALVLFTGMDHFPGAEAQEGMANLPSCMRRPSESAVAAFGGTAAQEPADPSATAEPPKVARLDHSHNSSLARPRLISSSEPISSSSEPISSDKVQLHDLLEASLGAIWYFVGGCLGDLVLHENKGNRGQQKNSASAAESSFAFFSFPHRCQRRRFQLLNSEAVISSGL
jgi:hypothetical protein